MTDSELMQLSEQVGLALKARVNRDDGGILHRRLGSQSDYGYCRKARLV